TTRFPGVTTDGRGLRPGELFVAICGEAHDGHDFLADAAARGAGGVVIAGKGHEDYQIIGETKHHFSDVEVAQEALAAWKGRA
ncbi:MAG: UDP-N-acetylmuramoyl-tripeptide--D-alanyl-D-alanine ligase, partial [Betaproteobacteria bacterium]|nr:UDP-N-acetylmuramoyl-tripeptide--D-alanyl-D-alanine ligase [Betaproteobacteria bacterium]